MCSSTKEYQRPIYAATFLMRPSTFASMHVFLAVALLTASTNAMTIGTASFRVVMWNNLLDFNGEDDNIKSVMAVVYSLFSSISTPSAVINLVNLFPCGRVGSNSYRRPETWTKFPQTSSQQSKFLLIKSCNSFPVAYILATALPKGCISTRSFLFTLPAV